MILKHWVLAATLVMSAALSGCTTVPSVRAMHSPLQPTNSETVTFTARARAPAGLSQITIWQRSFQYGGDCAAWVAGKCVPLKTFVALPIKTCTLSGAPTVDTCTVDVGPFQDGSFITYGATAKDVNGWGAEDRWIGFAAGEYPYPDDPIPVYVRGEGTDSVDIVFIPDRDYVQRRVPAPVILNNGNQRFLADVHRLLTDGYFANTLIDATRKRWNFYVTYKRGSVIGSQPQPAPPAPPVPSCQITPPSNWANLAAVVNTAAYVHTRTIGPDGNQFRDCAPGFATTGANAFMITASGTASTAVHETGHAAFGLSDEYCCDGGIITTAWPHPNMFATQADCQTSATAHGVPMGNCTMITTTTGFCGGTVPPPAGSPPGTPPAPVLGATNNMWRQDDDSDLMGCGANTGGAAGTLDVQRILWYYDNN